MRTLALFFSLFIVFVTPACAKEPQADKLLDIQEVISDNGIKAWLVEDKSIPVISLQFAFQGAGAVNDPADKQGLARLLSNTMDEGAGDLDSQTFQKELQDLSISLSFNAGRDDFGGDVKTLTKNSDRAFELLKLALTKPRFDADPVQRMILANQARIRSSLSDPDYMAARILNDVAFAGHPYAQNSGGTLSTLAAITPEDLRKFQTTYLGKNNLIVAVAGDIDAATLKTKLDQMFGDLPNVTIPDTPDLALQNMGKIAIYEQNIPQTVIEIMQPGIARKDPEYHAAQVMNYVLGSSGFGSRLTEEIREKRGLTYGVYSYFYTLDHLAALSVSTSTKNESVTDMLAAINDEFTKMRDGGITQAELDDAKSYLLGSLPLSLTSTDKIAGLMLSLLGDDLPIDYLDQRAQAIENMSVQDIAAVAKNLLSPQQFVTILVGHPTKDALGAPDQTIRVETLPNVE